MVDVLESPVKTSMPGASARKTIQTTLYDLIAAVSDEVSPELVTPIVVHLLRSSEVTFLGKMNKHCGSRYW